MSNIPQTTTRLKERASYLVDNLATILKNNDESKYFLSETIKPFNLYQLDMFGNKPIDYLLHRNVRRDVCIDPFRIVGSSQAEYMNKTWGEAVKYGITGNIGLLKENPEYYTDTIQEKPSILISSLNGELFVDGDGNHRVAIAKLLFSEVGLTKLHGVTLTEHTIDTGLMLAHNRLNHFIATSRNHRLRTLELSAKVKRENIESTSTPTDMLCTSEEERWEVSIEVTSHTKNKSLRLCNELDVLNFLHELKRLGFFGSFGNGIYKDFLY